MKSDEKRGMLVENRSHPARGAWIEMVIAMAGHEVVMPSHPARGAWIEIAGGIIPPVAF